MVVRRYHKHNPFIHDCCGIVAVRSQTAWAAARWTKGTSMGRRAVQPSGHDLPAQQRLPLQRRDRHYHRPHHSAKAGRAPHSEAGTIQMGVDLYDIISKCPAETRIRRAKLYIFRGLGMRPNKQFCRESPLEFSRQNTKRVPLCITCDFSPSPTQTPYRGIILVSQQGG